MRTATGKEDPQLPLLQTINSLELTAPQIAVQINKVTDTSPTSTVQRRLCESGLHGRIDGKELLLKYTNKKKRLAWLGQETRAMDMRPVEICPLV